MGGEQHWEQDRTNKADAGQVWRKYQAEEERLGLGDQQISDVDRDTYQRDKEGCETISTD